MTQSLALRIAALALTCSAVTSQAGLIGDTVAVAHYYPDLSTIWSDGGSVVVPATVTLGPGTPHYTVGLADSSISVNFLLNATWIASAFDGLVVGQIDEPLAGASVDTNLQGWNDSRLSFDADSLSANWGGLSFNRGSYFNVNLTFQPIPEPSTYAMAFAGLLGAFAIGRRVVKK